MINKSVGLWGLLLIFYHAAFSQVDTTFIYRTGMPYGTLDIRIAKSATRYYYLEEGKTFSFRESSPGVKTNSYRDMTSWDSSPYTQGNLRERNGTAHNFIMNYRLLLPVSYNATIADGYPLIVMMHGLGERGNCWDSDCYWDTRSWRPTTNNPPAPTSSGHELLNNDHNLLHGGSVHLAMRNAAGSKHPNDPTLPQRSFPGFVLFPQNLNGWDGGQAQDVIRIVRLLTKKYKIDPNRIYIHGLSNGGAAVFDVIKRAPWLFSAAAGMSAVHESSILSTGLAPKISTIALWFFQGGKDTAPSPARTRGYVKRFREAGLTVRYNEYPNLGHGTWNTAYNEPDFFSWLRSRNKTNIHVFADNPTLCQTTGQGVKMDLAEGFLAYQWERNGAIISGANTASYTATTTGVYRARFSRKSRTPSEAQWNQWSEPVTVVSSSPAQAAIEQTGTVVLKDLNFYNYAHVFSAAKADHYYWYKDGVLLNLSGDQDDTTRYVRLSSTNGKGAYTLVTAGFNNCPSPRSAPKNVFFNDEAPINITAPTTFTSGTVTNSSAVVNWTDASSNEGGFEIWRRKKTGTTTYTKWVMATLTGANVRTFNDTGLEPSSTYQYKIRAVSSTGRSNYTPLSSSQFLTIVTAGDSQAPTVPQNLTASSTAIKEITLSWQASTDNTGIREYVISYGATTVATGSPATTFKLTGLPLNTNFSFTVRAKDLGNNLSGPSNAASGNTFVTGLYYEHSTGAWNDLDVVNWNNAEFTGKVANFTLAPRTQEDYFNFEFDGYLYITAAGSYQFQTTSDDGSRLTIDATVAVDNDGLHSTRTITGPLMTLSSGAHTINCKYIEDTGGANLTVRYKGPDTGNSWLVIPNSALRSSSSSSATMMMASAEEIETIEPATPPLQVTVYPNPSTSGENITVKLDTPVEEPVHVSLVNMMGKPFYENTFEGAALAEGAALTPSETLSRGIYLIVIRQGDQVIRERVLVKD